MSGSSVWQRLARRYASQPIARSIRCFPYGRLIGPWIVPPRGFAKTRGATSGSPAVIWLRRSAYRFGFSVEFRRRFTKDWGIRNVRAMAAGLTPALNDARMRFAFPSGISSILLIFLSRNAADWPCEDVPVAAAIAVSFLGAP